MSDHVSGFGAYAFATHQIKFCNSIDYMGNLVLGCHMLFFYLRSVNALQALTGIGGGHLSSQNPYSKKGNHLLQAYPMIINQKRKVHFQTFSMLLLLAYLLNRTKLRMLGKLVVRNSDEAAFCESTNQLYLEILNYSVLQADSMVI